LLFHDAKKQYEKEVIVNVVLPQCYLPVPAYFYTMLIQQNDNGKNGAFYIRENGELFAEMTYRWTGDHVFTIDHTEVSDKLAGKGVGKQLVQSAVEFARANGHKIIPVCPFAKKVLERTEAYGDVLYHDA
jgi:predicted GNAT family acetyltransferase